MSGPSVETHAYLLRRNIAIPLLAAAMGIIGYFVGRSELAMAPWGALAAWIGLVLTPLSITRNAFPRAKPISLIATSRSLEITGRAPIPTTDIAEAKLIARPARADSTTRYNQRPNTVIELVLRDG